MTNKEKILELVNDNIDELGLAVKLETDNFHKAITDLLDRLSDEESIELMDNYKKAKEKETLAKSNKVCLDYLRDTDWIVLRHLGQREMKTYTSLTEDEYAKLLIDRQKARDAIIKE